jgi:hypothetical protein
MASVIPNDYKILLYVVDDRYPFSFTIPSWPHWHQLSHPSTHCSALLVWSSAEGGCWQFWHYNRRMNFSILTPATPSRCDCPLLPNNYPKYFSKGCLPSTTIITAPWPTVNDPNTQSLNSSIRLQMGRPSLEMPPSLCKSISCNQLERKGVLRGNKENQHGKSNFYQHRRVSTNLEGHSSMLRIAPQMSLKSSPDVHKHPQSR